MNLPNFHFLLLLMRVFCFPLFSKSIIEIILYYYHDHYQICFFKTMSMFPNNNCFYEKVKFPNINYFYFFVLKLFFINLKLSDLIIYFNTIYCTHIRRAVIVVMRQLVLKTFCQYHSQLN